MNILTLCTANHSRSPAVAAWIEKRCTTCTVLSAGLNHSLTAAMNGTPATEEMLKWADKIFVMEQRHYDRIKEYTGYTWLDKIYVLEIPDIYGYMDASLFVLLDAHDLLLSHFPKGD
ncbi:MAG: phosphotyrosine protein phosphatase [Bacteroidia bacterium]|jgi:predicted protein tyrosine phosphatase|nr:phosphotyrosine protein phosphatase [Bacteroidia bacterium]